MRTHTDRELRLLLAKASVGSERVPLDLAGANLAMANLAHADLSCVSLAGANLRGAMLWGARLAGACLDDADLTCANLTWATLAGCSLRDTVLIEADLDEAVVDFHLGAAFTAGADTVTCSGSPPTGAALETEPRASAYRSAARGEVGRSSS